MTCFILWISCYFRLVITFYYISWIDMATRRFCVAIPSIYRSSVGLNIGIHTVNNKRWQNALTKLFIILHHFIHKFYFCRWKIWSNMHFHSKMAWTPATYNGVSRNQSNWRSLNFSQNVREGLACEHSRFSSLFAAGDVSRGGASAAQRQRFHIDDVKSVRNEVRSADWSTE